jgi:hypothetical protein
MRPRLQDTAMTCTTCGKPFTVSAYSAYVSAEMTCQCKPPAKPADVTGNLYPPLAYASIAPSLSEQPLLVPGSGGRGPALLQGGAMVLVETPEPTQAPQAGGSKYGSNNYSWFSTASVAEIDALTAAIWASMRPPTVARTEGGRVVEGHKDEDIDAGDLISMHLRMGKEVPPPCRPDPAMPQRVRYLRSEAERAPYKVQVTGGKLMYRGRPMDTTGARKVLKQAFRTAGPGPKAPTGPLGSIGPTGPMGEITNRFLYVMSVNGEIYAGDMSTGYKDGGVFDLQVFNGISVNNTHRLAQKFGSTVRGPRTELLGFHHSSFLAGDEVACAGEIEVTHGKLVSINNNSGHYTPPPECLLTLMDCLTRAGVDAESYSIGANVSDGMVHGTILYSKGRKKFIAWMLSQRAPLKQR